PPTSTPLPYTTLFRSDAVVAAEQRKLSELQAEEEEIRALIGAKQMQFVSMLRAALAELEALFSLDEADEVGNGDLPAALHTRVRSEEHTSELQSPYDL